jgi:enoyl-CoA hydratase/carnithine racemase
MNKWIITDIKNKVGFITLNCEKSLNALSLEMAKELFQKLEHWKHDDQVACVFLQGAGPKAFCAGGDVRKLYEMMKSHPRTNPPTISQGCIDFFSAEYSVDYLIHVYPKPIIVWGDGIVMGGGIGLMNGGSHRIVTERSVLAMPEITIGLYPDVGATWFLNNMPPGWGLFMGMTAARVGASDALYLGLADHYLSSSRKSELLEGLEIVKWEGDVSANRLLVSTLLAQIESRPAQSEISSFESMIEAFEYVKSVDEFRQVADTLPKTEWIKKCLDTFEHGSPTSAAVIIEQLRRGKHLSLEEVFQFEMKLSLQFTVRPDFEEGVRALLVDKDQKPKWVSAQEVTKEWVEGHF